MPVFVQLTNHQMGGREIAINVDSIDAVALGPEYTVVSCGARDFQVMETVLRVLELIDEAEGYYVEAAGD
jgi:hypothetical protein